MVSQKKIERDIASDCTACNEIGRFNKGQKCPKHAQDTEYDDDFSERMAQRHDYELEKIAESDSWKSDDQ